MSHILIYIQIYLLLVFIGIGYSLYAIRSENVGIRLAIAISPIVGASLIMISGVFIIAWGLRFTMFKIAGAILSAGSFALLGFWIKKISLGNLAYPACLKAARGFAVNLLYISLSAVIILAAGYSLNNYVDGKILFRLNADIAAYGAASNYLLGIDKLNGLSNEILHRAIRWGLPSLISFLSSLLQTNVYQILFPTVYIIFISGTFVIAFILNSTLVNNECSGFTPFLVIMVVFNGAILNYLNEGFYPQIFSIIFANIIISLLFSWRNRCDLLQEGAYGNTGRLVILTLVFSALLTCYSEGFLFAVFFILGCFFLDLVRKDYPKLKIGLVLFGVIAASLLLVYPISYKIFTFSFANAQNINNIGYPQPTWMFPSDIIGLSNMYSHADKYFDDALAVHLVERTGRELVIGIILSVWVVVVHIYQFWKRKDGNVVLVIIGGILCIWTINIILYKHFNYLPVNYLYDKMSTMFTPIASGLFLSATLGLKKNATPDSAHIRNGPLLMVLKHLPLFLAMLLVVYSGTMFLKDSGKYKASIDISLTNTLNDNETTYIKYVYLSNERGYRSGRVVGKYRYVDRTGDMILTSLLKYGVLDQWNPSQWLSLPNNKEIVIIANKSYLLNPDQVSKYNTLLETDRYLLVKTGKTISDLDHPSKIVSLFLK